MKKIFLALTLVLASGYAVNAVYAAAPVVKSELTKDGDKEKKKKKGATETKTATKSCSSAASGKSCCAGKK